MDFLIYLSMAVYVLYVVKMVLRFGIPPSLSETYYYLQNDNKTGYEFSAALLGMIFPLLPIFIEYSRDSTQIFAFLACAALAFVAVAPEFRKDLDHKIHVSATVIAAISSQIWVAVDDPLLLLLWLCPMIGLCTKVVDNIRRNARDERESAHPIYWRRPIFYRSNALFWVEMTAFIVTYIALII